MTVLTMDSAQLGGMRPSAFTPARATPEADALVRTALLEDFPRIREMLPEPYYLDRLGSAIFYRMPWLLGLGKDLSQLNVVELGCGRGLKAIPWSRLFRSYLGVDLDPEVIGFARRAAQLAGRPNLEFHAGNAADAVREPARFGITGRIDVVVLYAVVEHLTPPERKQVLGLCREVVQDGGMVVFCETPNRLIPHDGHSTYLHFFQTLPPEIAIEYIKRSPRAHAVEAVTDEESLYRWGQGASYHEFDLWLAGADGKLPGILADGWSHWPICDEPLRRDELALNEYLETHGPLAPPAFARYWLDAVFDGAAPAGSTPAAPRFVPPENLMNAGQFPAGRFDTPPMLVVNADGRASFGLGGRSPVLLLDLNQCVGEIAVEDILGSTLTVLNVEELRAARFPRWHGGCAVDFSGFGPLGEITLRPLGATSRAVANGVFLR
jgi:2-polyprenyl-3-methyl-5-hydroxy-6-metoxy-1,4-benzoquinol methylase